VWAEPAIANYRRAIAAKGPTTTGVSQLSRLSQGCRPENLLESECGIVAGRCDIYATNTRGRVYSSRSGLIVPHLRQAAATGDIVGSKGASSVAPGLAPLPGLHLSFTRTTSTRQTWCVLVAPFETLEAARTIRRTRASPATCP
jgi:hypothetical protein